VRAAGLLARFGSAPSSVQALVDEAVGAAADTTADTTISTAADGSQTVPPADPAPVSPVDPAPPNPVLMSTEDVGVLAAHVFSACRTANLSACAESIVTLTGLKDRATIDAAVRNASEIAGLCMAAKLPELTAQFVGDGLNPDQVRARLFDRVTQTQARVNSRQPVTGDTVVAAGGPKASSVYAARRASGKPYAKSL
jgi:hypothetical protein